MALGAVGKECSATGRIAVNIGEVRIVAMSGMAPQAEERGRLPQQIVRHGPVRFMADRTVFRDGRMLIGEWPLLLRMTSLAYLVDGRFP